MEVKTCIKKDTNEAYLREDGSELQEFKPQVGDILIPQATLPKLNPVSEKNLYESYGIYTKCKNAQGEVIKDNRGNDSIYVTLTKTMFNQLTGLVKKANVNIKEHRFEVKEEPRKSDGVPFKKLDIIRVPTKSYGFEDFDEEGNLNK